MTVQTYGTRGLLKAQLQLDPADTTRDAALDQALTAASQRIDRRCGRRFGRSGATPTPRAWPLTGRVTRDSDGELLLVDDIADPAQITVELGSDGGTSWSAIQGCEALPYNAADWGRPVTQLRHPVIVWPRYYRMRVRVTAIWGWPEVPAEVTQATVMLAARLYKRRDSPEGVAGNAEWGLVRVSRTDPDIEDLLGPYTLPGFA